ncbi:MAG: thioredoxin domain-containing protein [Rhodospirillaceae bacterium]|nr:thioredoxin domain-containing protein [Rhodospirillaceae bacterium]
MTRFFSILAALVLAATPAIAGPLDNRDGFWSEWSDATFERAAAEKKFVIVSLQSWWCPWCHVMNRDTWANPEVRAVLKDKFIPVHVDQDSRPDISQRYERWGWPATIIFGSDGTEIAKLRGFYSPKFFVPVLQETIKNPSPVDYGTSGGPERERTLATGLTDAQRTEIVAFIDNAYDRANGGWGKSKLVDGPTFAWFIDRAKAGDKKAEARVRRSLTGMTAMIDIEVGGISQVSLKPDWSAPAREFPMFAQQAALSAYARAWAMFGDAAYRDAADRLLGFLRNTLSGSEGGFYASMGLAEGQPGIDKRQYARETGQAIQGILAYYDATGEKSALVMATVAADWALRERSLPEGGFRHAERDAGGPYLADSVEMASALLSLHRSTGERKWLAAATAAGDFIAHTFVDPRTGGFFASATPDAKHLPKPIKQREDNVTTTRFFTLLAFYTGEARYREIAEAGMGYLTSPPVLGAYAFLPDVLLAEEELRNEPVHITVVGPKDDARSTALYAAALRYPLAYKRAEWWDKREGQLANHDVDYPEFPDGPAAFACTRNYCSLPVTDPAAIPAQLDRLQRALNR